MRRATRRVGGGFANVSEGSTRPEAEVTSLCSWGAAAEAASALGVTDRSCASMAGCDSAVISSQQHGVSAARKPSRGSSAAQWRDGVGAASPHTHAARNPRPNARTTTAAASRRAVPWELFTS